jgi:hypothetical protein
MTLVEPQNGNHSVDTIPGQASTETNVPDLFVSPEQVATRRMVRARPQFQQNRYVIIAAGAIVAAILIFVLVSMPRKAGRDPSKRSLSEHVQEPAADNATSPSEKSVFPIIESQRVAAQTQHEGFLSEGDLERTAKAKPSARVPRGPSDRAGTLGAIPPFGNQENWQAPPCQPPIATVPSAQSVDSAKLEREGTDKSSLVFVRSATLRSSSEMDRDRGPALAALDFGLHLPIGTRLRARLESAATSAVRTPLLAVIEYNYQRDGEIIVPAGTKAVGHLQDADRSGYVRLQFDSLLTPDGATLPIQAVATDLQMKPIRGKVEGKHTGKNILLRSLSGIGQAGAMLVGRGGLDQPLSESDLLRERVSNNIGEASDEQISRLNIMQNLVITIPADTPIYVVVEQGPKANPSESRFSPERPQGSKPGAEELRELLQLQRELNQTNALAK